MKVLPIVTILALSSLALPETHVFWYKAKTNYYDISFCTDSGKGPCLPSNAVIHEGLIATGSIAQHSGSRSNMFSIGNGLAGAEGRCSFFWAKDLSNLTGHATSAIFRGEYLDGFHDNCQAGPITINLGVVNFAENISLYCGSILSAESLWNTQMECVPETAKWIDEGNLLCSSMAFDVSNPKIAASDSIKINAPTGEGDCWQGIIPGPCYSLLDSQFFSIDITNQVNWILSHEGQFAVVFLVQPGRALGGTGKFLLYAFENYPGFASYSQHSDNPWSRDGNSCHLVLESNDLTVKNESAGGTIKSRLLMIKNIPNPFKATTNISYSLPGSDKGILSIYSSDGSLILRRDVQGNGVFRWDAGKRASGVYLCKLTVGKAVFVRKMMLMR